MVHKVDCSCSELHKLCYFKNVEGASNLLRAGVDVNKKDCYGRTPLMCVFLLYRGVEKDIKKIKDKLVELTTLLLNKNAKINESDENGDTVFHHIAKVTPLIRKDKILLQPVRLLLTNGGDAYLKNNSKLTAHQIAFENRSINIGFMLQANEMNGRRQSPTTYKKETPPPNYKDAVEKTKYADEKLSELSSKASSVENIDTSVSVEDLKEKSPSLKASSVESIVKSVSVEDIKEKSPSSKVSSVENIVNSVSAEDAKKDIKEKTPEEKLREELREKLSQNPPKE